MKTPSNTVAYLGEPGSFSHIAAEQYFSAPLCTQSCVSFYDVFEAVASGACRHGIIPIENTLTGSLYENYDNLIRFKLNIVGETFLRVEHALLVTHPGVEPTIVMSHPKVFEQCSQYLKQHIAYTVKAAPSTTHAAATIAKQPQKQLAAIAHPSAAARYGLYIRQRHLEDNDENYTRFFVVSRNRQTNVTCDKATVRVVIEHRPGSLSRLLDYLRMQNINLTKIESRPLVGRPFEYQFYLDMHYPPSADIQNIIKSMRGYSREVQLLGNYISAQLHATQSTSKE